MYIHCIHKWRTHGKKLVPGHESEALQDEQKLQIKTFNELAECSARIPPKMTLCGLLFQYDYVGCLQSLMFSTDFLFTTKRDAYIFKKTGWFCRFQKHQNSQLEMAMWAIAACRKVANMLAQTSNCIKPSMKASVQFCKTKIKTKVVAKKKRDKRQIYGLLVDERDLRRYTKQVKTRWKKENGWRIHSRVKRRKNCYKLSIMFL